MRRKRRYNRIMCSILILMFFWFASATTLVNAEMMTMEPLMRQEHNLPPIPRWILPSGHNDPENTWQNETKAYDGFVATKAGCTIYDFYWTWTPWLELTVSAPITCDRIRFYAWYDELHCNRIDFDIYYDGDWHHLYQGPFADREWVEYSFMKASSVTKARVCFHVQRWILWPVTADLHEFQFFGYLT
ncbi:MAG: hypothetical protein V1726_02325 [Methanobacteriota archaeon]